MMPLYKPLPERWPQFSLKGLFVLVLLLAIPLGWVGVQLKWIRDRHAARVWLTEPDIVMMRRGAAFSPWSIRIFGEPGYEAVELFIAHPAPSDDDHRVKRKVESLFPEAKVAIVSYSADSNGAVQPPNPENQGR